MKAWRITHIKSNWPFIVCHENQLKINTSWAGKYNPEKSGVTVEEGQFLTDEELEQIKEQIAREAFDFAIDWCPDLGEYELNYKEQANNAFDYFWQQKNKGEG